MATFYKMKRPNGSWVYINPEHVSHAEPIDERSSRVHFDSGKEEAVQLTLDDLAGRLCK